MGLNAPIRGIYMRECNCENCKYGVDYGDSVEYIYCEKGRKKDVKKTDVCNDHAAAEYHSIIIA